MKKKKKVSGISRTIYSPDEKIEILRYWEDVNMDCNRAMARYKISRGTLFNWKREYWQEMQESKKAGIDNAEHAQQQKSVMIPLAEKKRIDSIKLKASKTIDSILDVILLKLEREMNIMEKDKDSIGKLKVMELSKMLDVASSYVLPKPQQEQKDDPNKMGMQEKYSRITQYIQNNFNINKNGSKENTPVKTGRLVTIHPGTPGISFGNDKSEASE